LVNDPRLGNRRKYSPALKQQLELGDKKEERRKKRGRSREVTAIPNSKDYACHPPRSELRG
jgi:hypothetical protein